MNANVNLTQIATLKQEFTDASNAFKNSPNDVLAGLRLIAAGFNAGQETAVEPLALNPIFIKAAPAMVNVCSVRAEAILLAWASTLWGDGLTDAAIQMLTDCVELPQFRGNNYGSLRDQLRTFHYYFAAKGYMEVRPTARIRIEHLKAILNLGFELGYVYKLLAECYHEIRDNDLAKAHLQKALAIDPYLSGAKKISKALGLLVAEPPKLAELKENHDFSSRRNEEIASHAQTLLRDKYELLRSGAMSDQSTIEMAEALLQTEDRTSALECIRIRYAGMTATAQRHAQDILWDVLSAFEFIGEKNYVWALNLLLASMVTETNPNQLLPKLHRMARIMEPIGQTDMGIWIRHTLRAEAPGQWFGDKHDRLNYFRYPQISDTFQQELDAIFAKYKPLINVALTNALQLPNPT